jgi:hypothetical protein
MGKPEGKRPFGRSESRWEDNMKVDRKQIGGKIFEWIGPAQGTEKWANGELLLTR